MTTLAAIRNSALWAAWGDALGFITELVDESRVIRRVGRPTVSEPLPWRRRVGGRFGAVVELPAGTYSDDTQLRLATSRAIRGDGTFSVESFSKIELTAWLAYALGGGLGVRSAASNLLRKSITWTGNVYSTKKSRYDQAGGNGAAMRIQPHVWSAPDPANWESFTNDVVRNAIVTHGHPRGILGAVLHGCCLGSALARQEIPNPEILTSIIEWMRALPSLIRADEDLANLWVPRWESVSKTKLEEAFESARRECVADLKQIRSAMPPDRQETWVHELASAIGAINPVSRGSGTKTAILGAAAVWMSPENPTAAVRASANALGTDTDTIATMAGAIAGAVEPVQPPGPIQDVGYISNEAVRLKALADGKAGATHSYPDTIDWTPPRTALDLVGTFDSGLAIAGLGPIRPLKLGRVQVRDVVWEWSELAFGQQVLIRRRARPKPLDATALPGKRSTLEHTEPGRAEQLDRTLFDSKPVPERQGSKWRPRRPDTRPPTAEFMAQQAIRSGFDPATMGRHVHDLLEKGDGAAISQYVRFLTSAFAESRRREAEREGEHDA